MKYLKCLYLLVLAVVLPSCAKEKADITLHYYYTNGSEYDLKIRPSGLSSFDLPVGATEGFTEIAEGIDYRGSCSFGTVFEDGGIITISYKGNMYDFDVNTYTSNWYIDLREPRGYQIHKDAPREYTLKYNFNDSNIIYFLSILGVREGESWQ